MANKKISSFTELTQSPATGDVLPIVDVSDTTGAPTGTTKKVSLTNLSAGIVDISTSQLDAASLVTESEGISSNDNDTTLPTSAAVKDYVDSQILTKDNLDEIAEGTTNKHFTATDETKLDGIESGAEVNVQSDWNVSSGDAQILNKPTVPSALNDLSNVNASPSDGQVLKWVNASSEWQAGDDAGGSGTVTSVAITGSDGIEVDSGSPVTSSGTIALGTSFTQTGTGASARTITDKLKDVVSVKDFGAAGDNSTDDSSAIQAAIDAVDGGLSDLGEIEVFTGAVFLPSGRYKIDSSITLKKGVHLIGESQSSVLIRYTGSGKALATSTGASDENQFIWIRDLTIEGAGKSTTTHGLHFNGSYFDSGIERVSVTKCAKGIELERSWTFAILKSHFYECADGGVWDNGTAGLVSHTRFDQCDNIGLTVTSTASNTHHLNITDSVFQRCGQNGLKVEAVNWSGQGLYFEYNNADDGNHADLHLSGGSLPKQASVRDSTFIGHTSNANDAIYSDTRELQLIGCFVSGSNYDSSLNGTANQNSVTVIGGQHSLPLDVDSGTAVNIESSDSVARLRSTGTGGIGIYGNPAATESFAVSTAQGREYINFEGATNQYVVLDTPAGRRNNIIFKSDGVAKFYVGRGDSDDVGDDWFYVDGTDNDTSPSFGVKTDGRIRFAELPTSASGLNDGEIWNDDGVVQLVGGSNSSAADSFTQTGTGASARTITDKLKDVVSVKDFGATGDGSTDDTTEIEAAIAHCQDSGENLYFPPGEYKITTTISLSSSGNSISLIGQSDGAWQNATAGTSLLWAGGANPMFEVSTSDYGFVGFHVRNEGTATDFVELTSGAIRTYMKDMTFYVNSGASAFSRSVVRSSGNRLGYSRFEHIECYGAAPKFVDIDGQSSSNGITPFYFGGRSIFESTSTQAMTVLYVKDETVDNVVIENCTFNQQGSELTIIDTTDTAATVTINSLSIRDIEWDYSVAGATSDRALKLKNVKNFTVTGGHWNCGGTVTAVAELENTNLVNCEGLYIRSAALFFDVDSDSTINLGRNYTDTSNVTRIVNDSAPGVIPVTWTAGNVLILGHTGAGNGHTIYEISPTSGSGWTLSYRHGSAGYLVPGQMITIRIKNASGGAISAGTPVSTFRTTAALVAPEDGYSRYYTFIWDGSAWNEVSRSEKDVSNSGTNTATGVIIDNSQRLGIGTAPSDLLHLSSSSPVIRGDDSDGGSAKINFGSGNITLDADHGSAQGSSIINFKVDGTEAGRFTDDGTLDLKSEKLKLNGSGGSADQVLKTDGSGNVSWSGGPAEIGIACSDETSALTEGECATVMVPKGLTIKEVKASLTEAGSSGGVQVNVKYHASNPNSAASIFTTSSALTIATSDYKNNITTFTDGSGGSQSTYTAAEDGFLVVDIPSSSSPDSAARGLKVWVLGEWS